MQIELAHIGYAVVGLGAVAVGINKFTGIFKPKKCLIDSCPDLECQGVVQGLVGDVAEMKPQLLEVKGNTNYIKGQVDILVQDLVRNKS